MGLTYRLKDLPICLGPLHLIAVFFPSLRTLSLNLCENSVGESVAHALAALKDAASLHTL